MKKEIDYIIVGQGVAGTLLHYFLKKEGKKVLVIDDDHRKAAAKVSAGIINPVTGRRYVKSWLIEQLIPLAAKTYQALEKELNLSFYHPVPIVRALSNRNEELFWEDRLLNEYYDQYVKEEADLGNYEGIVNDAYQYAEVKQSAQVEVGKFVQRYRETLESHDEILSESCDYALIKFGEKSVSYKHIQAQKIIFCEGNRAKQNPFFDYLPFLGAKGEALIVKMPEANFKRILKQRIFIVPLKDDLYWIGATNDKKYQDDSPSLEGKQYLIDNLKNILGLPFEIIEHKAAIRPTVKDRRPFLGLHLEHEQLAILNGLGTKGASLGPYFARQMMEFLTKGKSLMKEVNIERYAPLHHKK